MNFFIIRVIFCHNIIIAVTLIIFQYSFLFYLSYLLVITYLNDLFIDDNTACEIECKQFLLTTDPCYYLL